MKAPSPITHDDRVLVYVIRAVDFFHSLPVEEYTLTIHRGWNRTTTHKIVPKFNLKFELLFQLEKCRHEIIFVDGFCLNSYISNIKKCYQLYSAYWGQEVMMKTLLGICSSFIGEEHKFDDVTLLERLKVALDGVRTGGPLTYYSDRNWPLAGSVMSGCDVLTVETTDTWRSMYLIKHDGTVAKVDNRIITDINVAHGGEWIKNNCFHPYLLTRVAKRLGASVHPHATELAAGRWADDVLNLFPDPTFDDEEDSLQVPDILRRKSNQVIDISPEAIRSGRIFHDVVNGETFAAVGRELGISASRVNQIFNNSLTRLKQGYIRSDRAHLLNTITTVSPFSATSSISNVYTLDGRDLTVNYMRRHPSTWISAYETFVTD